MADGGLATINIYPFQWNYSDEEDRDAEPYTRKRDNKEVYPLRSIIRIWGWNKRNESICVKIRDFMIPMWIELPDTFHDDTKRTIMWTPDLQKKLRMYFNQLKPISINSAPSSKPDEAAAKDDTNNNKKLRTVYPPFPSQFTLDFEERKRLYNNVIVRMDNGTYASKEFTFVRMSFVTSDALRRMVDYLQHPVDVPGLGKIKLMCHCTHKLTPVMKLLAMRNLPSSDWIVAKGLAVDDGKKESKKRYEYDVSWQNIYQNPKASEFPIVHPLICSFDIETFGAEFPKFPDPVDWRNKIIQIGCTFARKGKVQRKVCLALVLKPDNSTEAVQFEAVEKVEDYEIQWYECEVDLLLGWTKLVKEMDADVFIGYNIFGFDIRYMYERAKLLNCTEKFLEFGCIDGIKAEFSGVKWESSARGVVNLQFLNAQGRLFIDLLPVIRASENLPSYKLEYVAMLKLGEGKDDITPKDIFSSWNEKKVGLYRKVIKYCVQDTVVTYKLFEKLLIWLGTVESATTNKVPIFCMVTQGQQIKAFSQVFDYCFRNGMVCNPPAKLPKQPYRGAIVTEPEAGLYKMILPFDFASLYPSIIIAHNIDFSRFVPGTNQPQHELEKLATCFQWSDHINCGCPKEKKKDDVKPKKERHDKDGNVIVAKRKDWVCNDYKYWFYRADVAGPGVVPTIIIELLAARKRVRKDIEKNEERIDEIETLLESNPSNASKLKDEMLRLKEINQVLDKRQLAYKVNANSMYGMFGAENGYLPFFQGAETVTFVGRRSIMEASDRISTHWGGRVIYNDTDSAYCYFEALKDKTIKEIWEFALKVVDDIATMFPKPMKLEFEGKIYVRFMIFTKKKYIAQMVDENGKLKDKMYMRGVPLVRREYCENMKQIYEKCVRYILNLVDDLSGIDKTNVVEIKKNKLFQNYYMMIFEHLLHSMSRNPTKKAVEVEILHDDEDVKQVFPTLMSHEVAEKTYTDYSLFKEFVIFKGLTKEVYATPQAHAEVAKKIEMRGTPVPVNSRIEYVLLAEPTGSFAKKKSQYQLSEDAEYFNQFKQVLRIDHLQYFNSQYVNYLNQMTKTIFGVDNAATEMFKRLLNKNLLLEEFTKKVRAQRVVLCETIKSAEVPTFTFYKNISLDFCVHNRALTVVINETHKDVCLRFVHTFAPVLPGTMLMDQYAVAFNEISGMAMIVTNASDAAFVLFNTFGDVRKHWLMHKPWERDRLYKESSGFNMFDKLVQKSWTKLNDDERRVFIRTSECLLAYVRNDMM